MWHVSRCCWCVFLVATLVSAAEPAGGDWKIGLARAVITPKSSMWMAGYGNRDHAAEGTLHDLWIKILILEDAAGNRAMVLTSDLLGFPRSISDNVCAVLKEKLKLERAQIMLSASHTHCGPALRGALHDVYVFDQPAEQIRKIEEYSIWLENKIIETAIAAAEKMEPAILRSGNGMTHFAVNRRNNPATQVDARRKTGELVGPIDHSVPVLAAYSPKNELKTVIFGYACHSTALSFYQWCGDYPGFSQIAIERENPGCQAMFFAGCGADQNPLPRGPVELAERYGSMLADEVNQVLRSPLAPIRPQLQTTMAWIDLKLAAAPTREELQSIVKTQKNYQLRWAQRMLGKLDNQESLPSTYSYPVQVWKLGGRQLWISLGGEVVVDYSLRLKREVAADAWVTGYANDVMAYIPNVRVLNEGGYEGATSMFVYGMPAFRWAPSIEDDIVNAVKRQVDQLSSTSAPAVSSNKD